MVKPDYARKVYRGREEVIARVVRPYLGIEIWCVYAVDAGVEYAVGGAVVGREEWVGAEGFTCDVGESVLYFVVSAVSSEAPWLA